MSRNNLLEVLWQMLEASDEIDLKPSLRACSRGRDFISVSNAFLVIIFFRTCVFFLYFFEQKEDDWWVKNNWKKRTDRSQCLFKST